MRRRCRRAFVKGVVAFGLLAAAGEVVRAQCRTDSDCNDGNPCTIDSCISNIYGSYCSHVPVNCDDGNACTLDSCDPATGHCLHTTLTCSDGDACTLGDSCMLTYGGGFCQPGAPVICNDGSLCTADRCDSVTGQCLYQPVSCDDGIACTLDSCDPLLGCVHLGTPGEAGPIRFTGPSTLVWDPLPDVSTYNTYRGTIPSVGGMAGRASGLYDHVCFESGDAQGNGATLTVDAELPTGGSVLYYLVDGELSCGEGTLGETSNAAMRPNPFPCPTPPP